MGLAVLALWRREIVRFLRDRSRVFSSIGQPVVFWVLFAGALHGSFRPGGLQYGSYFFVGALAMVVLFTAIFSTITVIEDRKEGFLQSVLVAPVPRFAIALGKVLGATTLALGHGVVFALLAPLAGVPIGPMQALMTFLVLALLAFALTAMGVALAWRMESTAGYHGVMMVVFMPMLLLSGAFFPLEGAHPIMKWLMIVDPLTYGVAALRWAVFGSGEATAALPGPWLSIAITAAFAALTFALATAAVLRRSVRDAR
jgi:ABC-2 type transport system permease protein